MGSFHEGKSLVKAGLQKLFHRDAAGKFPADGGGLPRIRHGRKARRVALIPAAVFDPAQPLGGVPGVAGHVVVQAEALPRRPAEGAAHQQLCRREGFPIQGHIPVTDRFLRQGHQPLAGLYVPLAPVAEAAQLHIADKAIGPEPLPHRPQQRRVGRKEGRVGVIGRVAFAVGEIVPAAVPGFFVEPIRDVEVGFRPRLVAEDAEDQMHPLLPQGIEVAGLLDGLPRIDALFRLQLPPRQAKVAQGHSRLVRACIQHTGRIADLRIGESRFVRLVHRRVLPPGPEQTPRQQQTGCGRRGPALSHGTRHCTESWSRPPRPQCCAAGR